MAEIGEELLRLEELKTGKISETVHRKKAILIQTEYRLKEELHRMKSVT